MSATGSTGVIRLQYFPTCANIAAPTVAELNAGVDLTALMTRDGLDTPLDGSVIDVAGANSRYNATAPGTYGGQPIESIFKRDKVSASDTAWNTLPPGTTGFYGVRRFGGATGVSSDAFVAGQKIEVWPIEVVTRKPMRIAENDAQKCTVQCSVPTDPNLNATVAA